MRLTTLLPIVTNR